MYILNYPFNKYRVNTVADTEQGCGNSEHMEDVPSLLGLQIYKE
jgi:hypothetical protein